MTIDAIMSRDVVTVAPDTALLEVRSLFHERDFRHLLVVADGVPLGVISDRDVLRALSPFFDSFSESHRDVQSLARPAHEVMQTEPLTVTPDTSIETAADQLLAHDLPALPVVEDGALIGILTTQDLLRHYTNGTTRRNGQ